jgi:hypothetical protein
VLRQRFRRAEALLHQREAARHAASREAAGQVAALRALLAQLGEADPFPGLDGPAYLWAFWPWLLADAGRWPGWAVAYALAVGGLPAQADRLARGGPPPALACRGARPQLRSRYAFVTLVR